MLIGKILPINSGVSHRQHSRTTNCAMAEIASRLAAAVVPRCVAFSDAGIRTI